MDNDRKINPLVERSKGVFLRALLRRYHEDYRPYNLTTEFAKTRRNRSFVIPMMLLAVVVALGAILVGVSFFVRSRTDQIQISDADLSRVSVNETLDEIKRIESQLRKLELDRDDLARARALELQLTDEQESQALIVLRSQQTDNRAQERALIQTQSLLRRQEIRDRFAAQIAALEGEIGALEQTLLEQSSSETESVLAQQQIFNPQRQLLELELSEQSDYFLQNIATLSQNYSNALAAGRRTISTVEQNLILKYNPIYRDRSIEAAIRSHVVDDVSLAPTTPDAADFFPELLSRAEWAIFIELARNEQALLDRLMAEPYTNSVPDTLQTIRSSGNFLFNRFSAVWSETLRLLRDRTDLLQQYEVAFETLALFNGDSGHIIDAASPNTISAYISESVEVTETTEAWVSRAGEVLRRIRFRFTDEGQPVGYTVEAFSDKTLLPFDRILIIGSQLAAEAAEQQ